MCLTCCDIGNDVQDDNDGGVDFDGENYSNILKFTRQPGGQSDIV